MGYTKALPAFVGGESFSVLSKQNMTSVYDCNNHKPPFKVILTNP